MQNSLERVAAIIAYIENIVDTEADKHKIPVFTHIKDQERKQSLNMPVIKSVAIWFVLDRSRHIENEDGKPDINRLDMLMLKNRLDQWKKEVRLQGYTPIIYVNYRTN